jgi:hypothetical protein
MWVYFLEAVLATQLCTDKPGLPEVLCRRNFYLHAFTSAQRLTSCAKKVWQLGKTEASDPVHSIVENDTSDKVEVSQRELFAQSAADIALGSRSGFQRLPVDGIDERLCTC